MVPVAAGYSADAFAVIVLRAYGTCHVSSVRDSGYLVVSHRIAVSINEFPAIYVIHIAVIVVVHALLSVEFSPVPDISCQVLVIIVDSSVNYGHHHIIAAGCNLPCAEQIDVRSGYGIRAGAVIMVMPLLRQVWVIDRILRRRTAFCRNGKSGIRPHGVYAHRKNRDGLSETYSLDRHNLFHDLYSLHLLQFAGSLGYRNSLVIPYIIPPVQTFLMSTCLEFSGIRKYAFHSLRPDSGKQPELRLDIRRELHFQSSGNDFHIVHLTHRFFCINIFRDFIQDG